MRLRGLAAVVVVSAVSLALLLAVSASTATTNLIANPSLEATADGVTPSGFSPSTPPAGSAVYTYLSTGHTGTRSVEVAVTKRGSAKVAWVPGAVPAAPK